MPSNTAGKNYFDEIGKFWTGTYNSIRANRSGECAEIPGVAKLVR